MEIYQLQLFINYINLKVKNSFFLQIDFLNGLVVNTTDAGNGILSVKIKQNGNKILHEQTRISDQIYEISFTPETADEYIVQLSFNGETNCKCLLIYRSFR